MSNKSLRRSALAAALIATSGGGILMPPTEIHAEQVDLGGPIEVFHNGKLVEIVPNIVPAAMRSYMLKAAYAGGAQTTQWYIAPFSNATDPTDTLTGTNFDANLDEFINYVELTRPAWDQEVEANQAIVNGTNLATITAGVGGGTVNGIVLISVSTKGNSGGLIAAATRFAAPRVMQETDTLGFRYTMQANLPA